MVYSLTLCDKSVRQLVRQRRRKGYLGLLTKRPERLNCIISFFAHLRFVPHIFHVPTTNESDAVQSSFPVQSTCVGYHRERLHTYTYACPQARHPCPGACQKSDWRKIISRQDSFVCDRVVGHSEEKNFFVADFVFSANVRCTQHHLQCSCEV